MSSVYSSTLLNSLNYWGIEGRRIIGQYLMSPGLFHSGELFELVSNWENKDHRRTFHELGVIQLTKGPTDAEYVDRRSCRTTEIWRKLTKCPADSRKVDGRFLRSTKNWCKFTDGPADAWKDDRSWRKVVLTQESWRNVRGCMEIWRKALLP